MEQPINYGAGGPPRRVKLSASAGQMRRAAGIVRPRGVPARGRGGRGPAGREAGFTLIEMLITLGIMVLIAGMTVPLFLSTRARTRRSDATNAVMAALASAREAAVERRTMVAVEFICDATSPNRGDFMQLVDKTDVRAEPRYQADPQLRRIGAPIPLPDFIKFETASPEWTLIDGWGDPFALSNDTYDSFSLSPNAANPYADVAYMPDGTLADPEGTTDIALIDTADRARDVVRVLPATGLVVRARHLQDPALPEGPNNPRTDGRGDNWI